MRPTAVVNPWGTPNREPNPALRPYAVRGVGGSTGVYDEMESGHPKIAKAYGDLSSILSTMDLQWTLEEPDTVEAAFIDDLTSLWASVALDAVNGIVGPDRVMAQTALYWTRGVCPFAVRWIDRQSTGPRRFASLESVDVELYPIHPSSVMLWDTDPQTGRLKGLRQSTSTGSAYVESASLVVAWRNAVPGQWEGVSLGRPLIFPFERWKSIWLSAERHSWTMAGTIILIEPPGASDEDRSRANQTLEDWQSGLAPWLILPPGWNVRFEVPTANDSMPEIEKIDSYIDTLLGNSVAALSYAAHATRALGDVLSEEQAQEASRELEAMLMQIGRAFARWVADQVAYCGRLPRLEPMGAEDVVDTGERVTELAAAVAAGLISWLPADQRALRTELGLADTSETSAPMSEGCGCGSCSPRSAKMADRSLVEVIGADGRPFRTHSPLQGVEVFVAWADNADYRAQLDQSLQADLESIATRHQADTWRALRNGWQPGESDALHAKWRAQYQGALEAYGFRVAEMVSRAAAEEAVRQAGAGAPRGAAASRAMFERVAVAARDRLRRAEAGLEIAADEIATKVQGEVERAWRAGASPRTFTSTLSARALALPAVAPANLIESEGRVLAAADMAVGGEAEDLGIRPAQVVRTSVMDSNRCEVCAARSQTTYDLPQQMTEWEAMPLPDPDCEGTAERCRCGWLVRWVSADA